MKNKLLFILSICMMFNGCSVHESIIDTDTGEKIVGYETECKYRIGKTKRETVTDIEELKKRGLYLQFNNNQILEVAYVRKNGYCTNKHICLGEQLKNVIEVYGSPQGKDLTIKSSGVHIGSLSGAFYERWLFFPDSLNNIKEITFGEHRILTGHKK